MRSKETRVILWTFFFVMITGSALAHFGMVIPSIAMVMESSDRTIDLTLSFSHPFEGVGMPMAKPKTFAVYAHGRYQDLLDTLVGTTVMSQPAWQAQYRLKRPGAHVFHAEPRPYWENSEDVFIVHFTKTVVAAFGDDTGWDAEIGLKTEIVPLSRPFGLYAGNVFQGIVKLDRQPVPYAAVEVEHYNRSGKAKVPTDVMVTQTIKANGNGVFTYAAPAPGWWGFAALNEADFKLKLASGEEKDVELGAVIWVRFEKWIKK